MTIKINASDLTNITVSGVAEEETLLRLATAMEEQLSLTRPEMENVEDLDDTFGDLEESSSDLVETQELMEKTAEALLSVWDDTKTAVKGMASAGRGFIKSMVSGSEGFADAYGGFVGPISDLVGAMIEGTGIVLGAALSAAGGIPILGAAAEAAGKAVSGLARMAAKAASAMMKLGLEIALTQMDAAWKMFMGVTNAGAMFGGGLAEMTDTMDKLNLTSDELVKLTKEHASELARFGGSVAQGAKMLARVNDYQKDYVEGLVEMGISNEEQAERTLEYMDMQQRSGQLRYMSDKEIAAGSREYMKDLQVITAMTGKQADEIKKEREERMLNMAFQTKMRQMTASGSEADRKKADQMRRAMDQAPEHLKKGIMNQLVFGNAMNDLGTQMSGMAPAVKTYVDSIMSGKATAEEAYIELHKFAKDNSKKLLAQSDAFMPLYMATALGKGGQVGEQMSVYMAGQLKFVGHAVNTAIEDLKEATAGGDSGGLAAANQTLRELNQDLMNVTVKRLGPLADAMTALNTKAIEGLDAVAGIADLLAGTNKDTKKDESKEKDDEKGVWSKIGDWLTSEMPGTGESEEEAAAKIIHKRPALADKKVLTQKEEEAIQIKLANSITELTTAWGKMTAEQKANTKNQKEYQDKMVALRTKKPEGKAVIKVKKPEEKPEKKVVVKVKKPEEKPEKKVVIKVKKPEEKPEKKVVIKVKKPEEKGEEKLENFKKQLAKEDVEFAKATLKDARAMNKSADIIKALHQQLEHAEEKYYNEALMNSGFNSVGPTGPNNNPFNNAAEFATPGANSAPDTTKMVTEINKRLEAFDKKQGKEDSKKVMESNIELTNSIKELVAVWTGMTDEQRSDKKIQEEYQAKMLVVQTRAAGAAEDQAKTTKAIQRDAG